MDKDQRNISINIKTSTILKALGIVLLLGLAYYLRNTVLIILTSVVIAAAINPLIEWGKKNKISRVLMVLLVYVSAFTLFFGSIFFLTRPLFGDLADLSASLPAKLDSVSSDSIASFTGGLTKGISAKQAVEEVQTKLVSSTANFTDTTKAVFGGVFSFILIIVISFYLSVQEKGIENFIRLASPMKSEDYILNLWQRSQEKIGKWLQGQIILALIIGLLVFLGLTILRVKYALVLGLLAALFEIIPFFGPILSAVPGVMIAFGDGIPLGLMVLGLYVIVHQFENHLIYPLVVKKIIGIPPLIVVIAIIVGWELTGFLGIILAVPAATVLMELASDIEKKKAIFANNKTVE